ncbi:hypothetical protein LCGC14_2804870 [marine sediment metagenome]|uniref:Uncharacterized protein n=1 Tax=marine sediment metagenome TaxID=412755 RepID=A0A0F8YLN2_9ZZZZ
MSESVLEEAQRPPLDRIEEYIEGTGRALRQDQSYDDLRSSVICLCNVLQNLVAYLKDKESG